MLLSQQVEQAEAELVQARVLIIIMIVVIDK